jgi:hypothetical protein
MGRIIYRIWGARSWLSCYCQDYERSERIEACCTIMKRAQLGDEFDGNVSYNSTEHPYIDLPYSAIPDKAGLGKVGHRGLSNNIDSFRSLTC